MPRCSHCGKVNREGSLFCQDCGHRLEAAPAPKAAAAAGATTCSACGTVNPPGMNFCKMCGTSLMAKAAAAAPLGSAATVAASEPVAPAAAPAAAPQAQAAKAICPACGKGTPVGFAFCQHCGQRLTPQSPGAATPQSVRNAPAQPITAPGSGPANVPASSASSAAPASSAPMGASTMGVANTMMPQPSTPAVTPTPPAGMPRNVPPISSAPAPRVAQPAATSGVIGGNGNGHAPPNDAFAQTMAPSPSNLDMIARASAARGASLPSTTAPDMPSAAPIAAVHGTLVAVNRDGSDGRVIEIAAETFDIGRSEGSLVFADDPYLASRHARLVVQNGKVIVRPLDGINGVFVRVSSCELAPGDSFLVGKELLRYEPLSAEEREQPALVEHGVRIFGSAPREAWGRLRQLTIAGTTRDVWHLTRPELVLGREEGDVTFPDDEFMSRRHAAVKRVGSKARLEDLGSSNGTFVRVRGERKLEAGDLLRIGDQLLRYEP